jgi:hypothetical protein
VIDPIVIGQVTADDIGERYQQSSATGETLWWVTDSMPADIVMDMQDANNVPAGVALQDYNKYLADSAVEATYLADTERNLDGVDVTNGIKSDPRNLLKAIAQGRPLGEFIAENLALTSKSGTDSVS